MKHSIVKRRPPVVYEKIGRKRSTETCQSIGLVGLLVSIGCLLSLLDFSSSHLANENI
jgi:hypothetical protein